MFHSEICHITEVKQALFYLIIKMIIFLPGKSILIYLIQQVTKWATSLLFSPEANAERHQKALESSVRPVLMQEKLLQARTEASDLWAETRDSSPYLTG